MKTKLDFFIPLSIAAKDLLEGLRDKRQDHTNLVFPSPKNPQKPISENTMRQLLQTHIPGATVHGMRANFRTWARETARAPDDIAEVALAHSIGSKTVIAYNRTDLFDERALIMEKWAMWLDGEWDWFDSHMTPQELDEEIKKRLLGPDYLDHYGEEG